MLLNIISNAYKFTPEGGSVTASVWESGAHVIVGLYEGSMLMFAHGFSIHLGQIVPPPFVDVTMPDRKRAETPIVAMTANAFKEDRDAAREAGMQAHIPKPVDIGVMMKTLAQVMTGN